MNINIVLHHNMAKKKTSFISKFCDPISKSKVYIYTSKSCDTYDLLKVLLIETN